MYYIIVTGSPVDGFQYYGKFDDHASALEKAEAFFDNESWWIAEVHPLEGM